MSAFTDDSIGVVWLLQVVNAAGTTLYRWASQGAHYGGAFWESRIVDLTEITRAFGDGGMPAAGSFSLTLDNSDSSADWLVDRATVASTVFSCRFKLFVGIYDPATAYTRYPTLTAQQLGEFVAFDFPSRSSDGTVHLSLADDSFGRLADLDPPPTLNDWSGLYQTAPASFNTCPIAAYYTPTKLGNWDAPLPLAFGTNGVVPVIACTSWGGNNPPSQIHWNKTILVTHATTGQSSTNFLGFSIGLTERAQTILRMKRLYIPQNGNTNQTPGGPPNSEQLWSGGFSFGIDKGSHVWHLGWIAVNRAAVNNWLRNFLGPAVTDPARAALYDEIQISTETSDYLVQGYPFSARTTDYRTQQHPVDVITDLISFYSTADASIIDTTSFAAAKAAIYNLDVSGLVNPARTAEGSGLGGKTSTFGGGQLREVLSEICASSDLEMFQARDGKIRLAAAINGYAEQTDTLTNIPEEAFDHVSERIPSQGERWAPYNRVMVDVGGDADEMGPYDNQTKIEEWGRVRTKVIKSTWASTYNLSKNLSPWNTRLLESEIRPVLEVSGGIELAQVELGQFITTSWTRGYGAGGTPYDGSVFRVDSITIRPSGNRVTLKLVWQNDLRDSSKLPFLLDSETLLVKSTGSGGRTLTMADGSPNFSTSSGDLNVDGVVAGDFVVMVDSSLAETNFTRFRACRISAVTGPKAFTTDDPDLDFDAGAGITITEWTIRAGVLGYPGIGGNYPNGSLIYGKVANDSGQYDGPAAAHKLLNG